MTRKLSASIAPIQNPFDSKTKDQTAVTISPSIAVDDAGDDRVYELGICEKVINVLLCRFVSDKIANFPSPRLLINDPCK
jgi:hypothetical protein